MLHRPGKSGLGAAYIAGFGWALERDYGVMVEIDADGSHQPQQLPGLLAALQDGADLVIGSRCVPGGTVRNWPKSREVLSRGGNTYARVMLGIKVQDATGGYRAYRASDAAAIALDEVESQGYCFQIELTLRAIRAGLTVVEVPDHLRGPDPRREQDEPGRHGRGAVARHPVGDHRPAARPQAASRKLAS